MNDFMILGNEKIKEINNENQLINHRMNSLNVKKIPSIVHRKRQLKNNKKLKLYEKKKKKLYNIKKLQKLNKLKNEYYINRNYHHLQYNYNNQNNNMNNIYSYQWNNNLNNLNNNNNRYNFNNNNNNNNNKINETGFNNNNKILYKKNNILNDNSEIQNNIKMNNNFINNTKPLFQFSPSFLPKEAPNYDPIYNNNNNNNYHNNPFKSIEKDLKKINSNNTNNITNILYPSLEKKSIERSWTRAIQPLHLNKNILKIGKNMILDTSKSLPSLTNHFNNNNLNNNNNNNNNNENENEEKNEYENENIINNILFYKSNISILNTYIQEENFNKALELSFDILENINNDLNNNNHNNKLLLFKILILSKISKIYFNENYFNKSLKYAEKALNLCENNNIIKNNILLNVLTILIKINIKKNNYENSIILCLKILNEINNFHIPTLIQLSISYISLGQYENCINNSEKIIEQKPLLLYGYALLIECYGELDDWENMESICSQALNNIKTNSNIYSIILLTRAFARKKLEKYNESISDCHQAISIMSSENILYFTALKIRGESYYSLGFYEKARIDINESTKINREPLSTYNNLPIWKKLLDIL